VPFTARHIDEVPVVANGQPGRRYDVELPYRRLGRCRLSDAAAVVIGTRPAEVARALSNYEARAGKHVTATELLGPGVDLGLEDVAQVVEAG
jgi:hypothetical protein